MCTFITVVVATHDPDVVQAVVSRHDERHHRRHLTEIDNPSVRRLLYPGERQFLATAGMCDCGTILGSQIAPAGHNDPEQARTRMLRKGWSEAKIARALADSARAAGRSPRQQPPDGGDYWATLLADLAHTLSLARVTLLHRHYRKGPHDEVFLVSRRHAGPIGGSLDVLPLMPPGVLHDFTVD